MPSCQGSLREPRCPGMETPSDPSPNAERIDDHPLPPRSVPISVTVITLDEEKNIEAALRSVQWADEIVVIDSGSSDRTVEICRELGARVQICPWEGYGKQKNLASRHCRHDWVLNLDADERVPLALAREIAELMKTSPAHSGYAVARRNFIAETWVRHGGWYPDYTLRLFDRRRARFSERKVHEALEIQGSQGRLNTPLDHFSYSGIVSLFQRANRYADLSAQDMFQNGKRFHSHHLVVKPLATFLKIILFRGGFRDGHHGLVLAVSQSCYAFLKYARLWELERRG